MKEKDEKMYAEVNDRRYDCDDAESVDKTDCILLPLVHDCLLFINGGVSTPRHLFPLSTLGCAAQTSDFCLWLRFDNHPLRYPSLTSSVRRVEVVDRHHSIWVPVTFSRKLPRSVFLVQPFGDVKELLCFVGTNRTIRCNSCQ